MSDDPLIQWSGNTASIVFPDLSAGSYYAVIKYSVGPDQSEWSLSVAESQCAGPECPRTETPSISLNCTDPNAPKIEIAGYRYTYYYRNTRDWFVPGDDDTKECIFYDAVNGFYRCNNYSSDTTWSDIVRPTLPPAVPGTPHPPATYWGRFEPTTGQLRDDSSLTVGEKYYYRAKLQGNYCASFPVGIDFECPAPTCSPVQTPVLVSPINTCQDTVVGTDFSWEAVSGADHYQLQVYDEHGNWCFNEDVGNKTHYVISSCDNPLETGIVTWRVKAFTSTCESNWEEQTLQLDLLSPNEIQSPAIAFSRGSSCAGKYYATFSWNQTARYFGESPQSSVHTADVLDA